MGGANSIAFEGNGAQHIVGDTITKVDVLVKEPQDASREGLVFLRLLLLGGAFLRDERLDRCGETCFGLQEATNPAASHALEYDACVPIRKARHLQDLRNDPDAVQVVLGWILHLHVLLRQEEDISCAFLGGLQRCERRRSTDQQGQDHVGEVDQVPKGNDGQPVWDFEGLVDPNQCRHSGHPTLGNHCGEGLGRIRPLSSASPDGVPAAVARPCRHSRP